MTTITTDRLALAEVWLDAFLDGLRAAEVPEDRFAELFDKHVPDDVRTELARKAARVEAEAQIQRWIDDGRLVRTVDGLLFFPEDYNPYVHGDRV